MASAYTTKAAVRIATGFSNTTNISDTLIDDYIVDASSIIDSKIADVYILPLPNPPPEIIEMICRVITCALLYFNEYGEESENLDKSWKSKLDWAYSMLEDIRTQKTKLVDGTTGMELPRSSLKQPSYYPTDTSSEPTAENSTAPKLTMNQSF